MSFEFVTGEKTTKFVDLLRKAKHTTPAANATVQMNQSLTNLMASAGQRSSLQAQTKVKSSPLAQLKQP